MEHKPLNADATELMSSVYDGETVPNGEVCIDESSQHHMQRWSLIGAAMRNELTSRAPDDFVDKVKLAISKEPLPQIDQTTVPQHQSYTIKNLFKKFSFAFTQIAVAASIAMVTVVGWQTWNAEDNLSTSLPQGANLLGTVGGANLTGFNNADATHAVTFNSASPNNRISSNNERVDLHQEDELINAYIRGYVFNVSSK